MNRQIDKITLDQTAKESTEHGNIFLPANTYHTVLDTDASVLMPHWHDEMEITLIRRGTSQYRVYSKSFIVNEGDLVLVQPHSLHSAIVSQNNHMTSDSLVFHVNYLGALEHDLAALNYLTPLVQGQFDVIPLLHPTDKGYSIIKEKFLHALDIFTKKPVFYEIMLKICLLELILLLFKNDYIIKNSKSDTEIDFRRQIHETLDYIHKHYTEALSVKDLAKSAGFSESYFMHLFKEYVGMTCINYINYYRIQKAAIELHSSSKSILEIAIEQGYDNISYFNRRFKTQFGMTPKEYRASFQVDAREDLTRNFN